MKTISLTSVAALTGKSERTLWRWISEGNLTRADDSSFQGKTMISLESAFSHFSIRIDSEDLEIIEMADGGNAEAQTDLALLFLEQNDPESAVYWLELAAKQDYPEAMHWLGRCHVDGQGVPTNENFGIMWLAKAAAHGHVISQAQVEAMRNGITYRSTK